MTSSSGQSGSRRRRVPSFRMPAGRVSRVVGRIVVGGLVQYFDWAATLAPLVVLGAWAAGGLGEQYGPHVRKPPAGRGVAAASASPAP